GATWTTTDCVPSRAGGAQPKFPSSTPTLVTRHPAVKVPGGRRTPCGASFRCLLQSSAVVSANSCIARRPVASPEMALPLSSLALEPRAFRRRVVDIDPFGDPRWVNLVVNHPDGKVYHHPAWLQAIHREYGRDIIGLACED